MYEDAFFAILWYLYFFRSVVLQVNLDLQFHVINQDFFKINDELILEQQFVEGWKYNIVEFILVLF